MERIPPERELEDEEKLILLEQLMISTKITKLFNGPIAEEHKETVNYILTNYGEQLGLQDLHQQ